MTWYHLLINCQAVQDTVGNGIDVKPPTSSTSRTKQEHGSDKMLVGDEADITGSSNTAKEKPKVSSQAKEHSKATEPESKSSRSDDKKSSEKSTKSSLAVNGPSRSDHLSKRVSDTGTTESQGINDIYYVCVRMCGCAYVCVV